MTYTSPSAHATSATARALSASADGLTQRYTSASWSSNEDGGHRPYEVVGGGGESDEYDPDADDDDDDDDEDAGDLGEREPLVGSSAISPSTGSSSLLRRNFRGPKAKRACTDTWALVVFGVYWVGMLALAVYAFTRESNVSYAKYIKDGVDFAGRSCGNHRFVYFPDFRANPDFGFCVDACPAKDGEDMVVELPLVDSSVIDAANGTRARTTVHFRSYATHAWSYVCAPANVVTEDVMIAQLQDTIGRFVGALGDCWQLLIITCGISLGTASLYLVFLRYCGCLTVFLSTIGIQSLLVYASYRLLRASADPLLYPNDPAMKSSLQISSVVVSCCAVLFCLLAFSMLPRLLLAGTFITHASKALHQLRKILVVPFLSFVMLIMLFAWAIVVTICIFGAGKTSTRIATVAAEAPATITIETESFRVNTHLRWLFFFHVWGVYWTATFILSIGEMVTSTAVSVWYFSPDDKVTSLKILRTAKDPVNYALSATFRYHLGTLVLSSATVTPISYVRSFFTYLQDKNEYDSNAVTTFLAKCCCCCNWCFNYCLKFICKEAFYITAIQGTNFYRSAKLADTMISSNLLRVGALSLIGHASVLLGKLIVCSTTCFIAWFLLEGVSSPVLPLVAIILFSYGVAHAFMTIYETTINMLLMCFTLDENMHGGRGNSKFAHATLVRSVNDHLRPKWQTVL